MISLAGSLPELVGELARSGAFHFVDAAVGERLFTWADLDRVLRHNPDAWHRVDRRTRRQFSLAMNSALLSPQTVLEDRGRWGGWRVSLERVHDALQSGATLMINDLHALVPAIRSIAHQVTTGIGARVTVRAFASSSQTPGFRCHIDLTDTVIVQTAGRKLWTVWKPTGARPVKNDVVHHAHPKVPPIWEGVLAEGDVLYVPAGWWHQAVGVGVPTLHLSIDIHRLSRWEIVRAAHRRDRKQASSSMPSSAVSSSPASRGRHEADLAVWSDVAALVEAGRTGSFFDDPRDGRFPSPVRAYRPGPEGKPTELDPTGRFQPAEALAAVDSGGMVRIEHAERFLDPVARRVEAIIDERATLATATLVGRGGPNGITLSGRAGTHLLILQAQGSATWEFEVDSAQRSKTTLDQGDTLVIPRHATYQSPAPTSRSLHLEVACESAHEACGRRVRQALETNGVGKLPVLLGDTGRADWLARLREALANTHLEAPS
jgi:mannose-6-phosphate isomerase-like protein (cupin superfamily)